MPECQLEVMAERQMKKQMGLCFHLRFRLRKAWRPMFDWLTLSMKQMLGGLSEVLYFLWRLRMDAMRALCV